MLARHRTTEADVTLGIFPTDHPHKLCPVKLDPDGHVLSMTDKPTHTDIMNTWGCACWSPRFSEYMHNYLASIAPPSNEVVLADVFQAAIASGLAVHGPFFETGDYIDIGTPDDLVVAVRRFSQR
jgi:glucose-1-phosphate thymidylyltransferase